MEKIISLYQRNYEGDHLVRDEVVPGAEWVLAGEGVPTRKWDGTCVRITTSDDPVTGAQDTVIWKRYDAKNGKTPPVGFEPAQEPDAVTGHWPGWLRCDRQKPEDRWFFEGLDDTAREEGKPPVVGTYELCGPKVGANPEGLSKHVLIRHGWAVLPDAPREFAGLREYLAALDIEGIVWHHPDGRMVKIKAKDFGLKRLPVGV